VVKAGGCTPTLCFVSHLDTVLGISVLIRWTIFLIPSYVILYQMPNGNIAYDSHLTTHTREVVIFHVLPRWVTKRMIILRKYNDQKLWKLKMVKSWHGTKYGGGMQPATFAVFTVRYKVNKEMDPYAEHSVIKENFCYHSGKIVFGG